MDGGLIEFDWTDVSKDCRMIYFTQVPEIFNRGFIFNVCLGNLELVDFILNSIEGNINDKHAVLFHMF